MNKNRLCLPRGTWLRYAVQSAVSCLVTKW
jgi:hypothetical protein